MLCVGEIMMRGSPWPEDEKILGLAKTTNMLFEFPTIPIPEENLIKRQRARKRMQKKMSKSLYWLKHL